MSDTSMDLDLSGLDKELLSDDAFDRVASYAPIIQWDSRNGYFHMDAEGMEQPGPTWEMGEHLFGTNPNGPLTPVWKTQRLRCVIMGYRKQWEVVDPAGVVRRYPWRTKRTDREEGDTKSKLQVALHLPGQSEMYVLSLNGLGRSMCWENGTGRWHNDEFGPGVWPETKEYIKKLRVAGKQPNLPDFGTCVVDLIPELDGKKIAVAKVFQNTYVAKFRADFTTDSSNEKYPKTRWVGAPLFKWLMEEMWPNVKQWMKEWDVEEVVESSNGGDAFDNYYNNSSDVEEDDDIPF